MTDSAQTLRPSDGVAEPPDRTAAHLFGLLWETLVDVLGAPATATLLRRSAKRAAEQRPELWDLGIQRDGYRYHYVLPKGWSDHDPAPLAALRALARELVALLADLTGPVVVRRLAGLGDLRRHGILPSEDAP